MHYFYFVKIKIMEIKKLFKLFRTSLFVVMNPDAVRIENQWSLDNVGVNFRTGSPTSRGQRSMVRNK